MTDREILELLLEKVSSIDVAFTKEQFDEKFIVKKGKKTFLKIVR